jgi:TfoX/Sxy family transcriptional regulator of competence genes
MAYDEALAERIRDRLAAVPGVTEMKMFGGLAFLSDGNMTVGVYGDDMLVRMDAAGVDSALKRPGVRVFDMMGRPAKGMVVVAGDHLDDETLDGWIGRSREFVATLPPKKPKKKK